MYNFLPTMSSIKPTTNKEQMIESEDDNDDELLRNIDLTCSTQKDIYQPKIAFNPSVKAFVSQSNVFEGDDSISSFIPISESTSKSIVTYLTINEVEDDDALLSTIPISDLTPKNMTQIYPATNSSGQMHKNQVL